MGSRRPCDNIDPEIVPIFFFLSFGSFAAKNAKNTVEITS